MKLFPQIPSHLELVILNYSNYCSVCKIHCTHEHPIKYCIGCDKDLCEIMGSLWFKGKNPIDYICLGCRCKCDGTYTLVK